MEQSDISSQVPVVSLERKKAPRRYWLLPLLALVLGALLFRYIRMRPAPEVDPLHGNGEETPAALAAYLQKVPAQDRLPILLKDTQDPSYGLRYAAVDALGAQHGPEIAAAMEKAFQDSDSEVRKRALEVLPEVDPVRGFHMMLAGLHDEDLWIRERAATELDLKIGPLGHKSPDLYKQAVPMLMVALDDPDEDVSHTAMDALRKLAGQPWHISRLAPAAARQAVAAQWHRWWEKAKATWPTAPEFANVPAIFPTRTDPCPDFAMERLDGKELTLQSQKGHITLLNFWGIGCGPCEAETQSFVELDKRYRARNVDVIGAAVGQQDNLDQLREWIHKNGVTFPQAISNPDAQKAFGDIDDVPVTVLIDQQGRICDIWEGGPRPPDTFSPAIERLLRQGNS